MKKIIFILFLLCLALMPKSSNAKEKYVPHGYIDFNAYHDTRDFRNSTINAALDLPYGFKYFSLTNLDGEQGRVYGLEEYLSEHNIYRQIATTPYYGVVQWLNRSGNDNDTLRFGARAVLSDMSPLKKLFQKINLRYQITFFPTQVDHTDAYNPQIEHVYRLQVLPRYFGDRLYVGGFVDHNMSFGAGSTDQHNFVSEHQIGLRLVDQLYGVIEYRHNGFFEDDKRGFGLGLEYKVVF